MIKSGKLIGRKYSRRFVRDLPDGGRLEELGGPHAISWPKLHLVKQAAIGRLEAAGVDVNRLLAESPSGSSLVEVVIYILEHDPDSPLGLAVRIVQQCLLLEGWQESNAPGRYLIGDAFVLGQLVMLDRAYSDDDAAIKGFQSKGADSRRKYTEVDKMAWCDLRNTDFKDHSDNRAAQLIIQRLSLPAASTDAVRKAISRSKAGKPL